MVQTETDAAARERGDTDAARSRRFQQLALPHLDAAYNLARWLCGNPNDADDVVQEAFMRAFRFFDTFRGDTARPWLLAIVRRTWYTEWRRRGPSHEMLEFDDTMDDATFDGWSAGGDDPQTLLIRDEDTKLVHEALAQLPVEYREVLILRELEEMGYREIAVVADLPIGTVMSRLARGRRKLAAVLTQKQGASTCRARTSAAGTAAQAGRPHDSPDRAQDGLPESQQLPAGPDQAAQARHTFADSSNCAHAATRSHPASGASEPPLKTSVAAPATGEAGPGSATTPASLSATAIVTPLRASANGRPLNAPGASAAGPAQEAPDGL